MRPSHSPAQGRTGKWTRTARRLALAVGLAVGAAPFLHAGTPAIVAPGGANPRVTPAVEVARRVKGAVVNIHSERTVAGSSLDPFHPLNASNRVNGMGTGIVLDGRGYIVTNQHVVDDVQVIRVKLADGSSYSARVVARDHEHDLAILKIEVNRVLPTIPLGTATDLMALEPVIAIGNAYGYEHTHTMGTVSSVKRDVSLNKDMSYRGLIQTDASINPGNSGGPLLNIHGELIGVNVAIRAGAQNIGFAIPVDNMVRVAADLLGIRRRVGIGHGVVVSDRVDTSSNPVVRTAVVDRVEANGPADRAGVRAGDQLVEAGGVAVTCSLDLERGFLDAQAGDKVTLAVRRSGSDKRLDLVLPAADRVAVAAPATVIDQAWRKLGVKVTVADAQSVTRVNPQLRGGVVLTEVDPDGPAGKAGMVRGDVLVGLHQFETLNVDNISWVLNHPDLASFSPLKFYLIRGGQVRKGNIPQVAQ